MCQSPLQFMVKTLLWMLYSSQCITFLHFSFILLKRKRHFSQGQFLHLILGPCLSCALRIPDSPVLIPSSSPLSFSHQHVCAPVPLIFSENAPPTHTHTCSRFCSLSSLLELHELCVCFLPPKAQPSAGWF